MREQNRAINNARHAQLGIRPILDYELDLAFVRLLPQGHLLKYEFLLSCMLQQNPGLFVIESEGMQNYWHVRMAQALCIHDSVIFLGCASAGKTYFASSYCYTKWKASPFNTVCYVSTTSAEAGEARTWGAIKNFFNKDQFQVGVLLASQRTITLDEGSKSAEGEIDDRDMRHGVKAVLVKSGNEGQNVVGAICGRKSENVIWCCDEMAFMDMGILEARVNLFSNPFAQFIGIGNAPREGSPLYIDAEPFGEKYPDGWRSVDKDRDFFWTTKRGICIYFNGEYSPNMKVGPDKPIPFAGLMNWREKEKICRQAGGEDNPFYWTQFYGFPASVDVPDKVLTYQLLEKNNAFNDPEWGGVATKTLAGLDLGFRADGDATIIDFGKLGKDVRGRTILAHEHDGIALNASASSLEPFEKQIGIRVVAECRKRNCHDLALDVSGDGGLMLQAIEHEARFQGYSLNVLPVSFSGSADDNIVIPGERRSASEMFQNKVCQLWMQYRLCVQNDVVRGAKGRCNATDQLCSRKYGTDEKKRFSIEKKSDMKKRIRRSPDHADARVLLCHLAIINGLSGAPPPKNPIKTSFKEATEAKSYSGHSTTARYSRR